MTHLLEVIHQYWNMLWQFMNDHSFLFDGLLSPLVMKILAVIGTGLLSLGTRLLWLWWRKQQTRPTISTADTFPFDIIKPNSDTVLQTLLGSANDRPDDPLADFNISYQRREAKRNVQKELYEHLNEQGWVLILGKTGFGKSREAAELAHRLNQEGWTVLTLKWWEWEALGKPSRLPIEQIGSDRRLLFFLDDLNRLLYDDYRRRKSAGNQTKLAIAPLQERLLQLLEAYETGCRQENVRVIATARNELIPERDGEPSELEKLDLEKFPALRDRFRQYPLPEPELGALIEMLQQTAMRATVQTNSQDTASLVAKSDRTFRIQVNNLRDAKRENVVLTTVYKPTLRGSWEKRYQDAKRKHPVAPYIYAAVGLLQSVGVELRAFTVAPTARLIAKRYHPVGLGLWYRWQIDRALRYLLAAEDILDPSDGQIEASGRSVDEGEYIDSLLPLLLRLADRHSSDLLFSLRNFGIVAYNLNRYPQALRSLDKVLQLTQPITNPELLESLSDFLSTIWVHKGNVFSKLPEGNKEAIAAYDEGLAINPDNYIALYAKGVVLSNLGHKEEAIAAYDEGLAINPDNYIALYAKGVALSDLGRSEEEIVAYDQALAIQPDLHEALNNKGVALSDLGRKQEAIDAYNQALVSRPHKHEALTNRGIALSDLGRYEEAIASCEEALAIQPDDANAYYNKACCYGLQRYIEQAIENLQRAIELDPKNREMAKADKDFDAIRDNDAFRALVGE